MCMFVYSLGVPSSAEVSLLMFVHSQGVPSSADLIHP